MLEIPIVTYSHILVANSHGRVSYVHFIEEVELLAVFKRGHGKAP
jgi:hypothetical protein